MKKRLIVFPHGIGDVVMLTACLAGYKKKYQSSIGLALVDRITRDGFRVDGVDYYHTTMNPWHDAEDFAQGMRGVIEEAKAIGETCKYDEVDVVASNMLDQMGGRTSQHKTEVIAKELGGVDIGQIGGVVCEPHPEAPERPYIAVHLQGGREQKRLPESVLQSITSAYPGHVLAVLNKHTGFDFPAHSLKGHWTTPDDFTLPNTAHVIKHARAFIGVDSGPGWIAASYKVPSVICYHDTALNECAPVYDDVRYLVTRLSKDATFPGFFEAHGSKVTNLKRVADEIKGEEITRALREVYVPQD
jgi:ADP-heptose:LPS heptosyltransferase